MEMRRIILAGLSCVLLAACSEENLSDAFGQFETDKTTVSAEASGKLLEFNVEEGVALQAGVRVGVIDTTSLVLRKKELNASIKSIRSNISSLNAQADVYKTQLRTAERDFERLTALRKDNATTQKQVDDAEGAIATLKKQITAVEVQKQSVYAEIETMNTRIDQVEDQIKKAIIVNPVKGIVLSKYAEAHELAAPGKPLYQIADTDELVLRVFVSGAQLPQVKLGAEVKVFIDKNAEENQSLKGTISWVSSEAEFTPKMIQTKEERVTQMYAVKIRVQNPDGVIKIGMPGEVVFN